MTLNDQKEQFSLAYVLAVAATAGVATYTPSVDDDSVDLGIATKDGISPRLELQLKCTATADSPPDDLIFRVKLKNYDDLRRPCLVPRLLIVVTVPEHPDHWVGQTDKEMVLRRCGYWVSLRNLPAYNGTSLDTKIPVNVPRNQLFTPTNVRKLLADIAQGRTP